MKDSYIPPHHSPGQPSYSYANRQKKKHVFKQRLIPAAKGRQHIFWKTVAVITIILLAIIVMLLWKREPLPTASSPLSGDESTQSLPATATKETPPFKTLLPAGRNITEYGGWMRVSPPGSEPVYAYAEKIGDAKVIVSQQQLPKSFSDNTSEQIKELAKGYHADRTIKAGTIDAYIGRNAKGFQAVIFTKTQLLILITSNDIIADETWTTYIQSLS